MAEITNGGSLMKKTKKELVDIILRKDDVEVKLRNEQDSILKEKGRVQLMYDGAKNELSKATSTILSLREEVSILKNNNLGLNNTIEVLKGQNKSYQDEIDSLNKTIVELEGLKEECDNQASTITELTLLNNKYKTGVISLCLIIVLMLVLSFI